MQLKGCDNYNSAKNETTNTITMARKLELILASTATHFAI